MVATYQILGRPVGSHVLAMATLGTTGLIAWASTRGSGKSKDAKPVVPINASSKDEEAFIQEFLRSVNTEEQKSKH